MKNFIRILNASKVDEIKINQLIEDPWYRLNSIEDIDGIKMYTFQKIV